MRKIILISINIFLFVTVVSCQADSSKQIAQENFEEYFKNLKAVYPADKFDYTFTEYSDLFEIRTYPNEMVYLSSLDSTNCNDKFYSLYAHKISLSTDEDIQVDELPVSNNLKRTYRKLRKLVLSSEFSNDHKLESEIELAKRMRELMKKEKAPLTGYGQTVHSHSVNDKGVVSENKLIIGYDLELNVVNMGIIE